MKHTCLFHISGNQYSPFPAKHHTRRIWDELSEGFDEYHVIARGFENKYVYSIDGSIHLHLLPALGKRMWPFFFLSWFLPFLVIRYKPTHLLAQCPVVGGLAAAFCSILFRIPLFVELHGAHYFAASRPRLKSKFEHLFYRILSNITFRVASRIRSLSEDMSENLLNIYGLAALKKVVVIPNRVDLKVFSHVKESYKVNYPIRIITVGNYLPGKNLLALIKDLSETELDFQLTMAGAGSLKEEYLYLADQLNIRDRITLVSLDHQSLAILLPQQDIYVHYSLSEGVPRAILEAMAAGLPVIATRVGFIKGVLLDNKNALVIDKPYDEGLNKSIKLLVESESLRARLGISARKAIEDQFEWNRVFDQYRTAIKTMPTQRT
jgi:glycosyltransferase involved in cell wall biosynthesis